ncbi:MAG: hypothetical protein ACRECL_01710 [Bradyrhizobium sp.]
MYCYIDECQNVIARDEKISTILDECRSQKIALILSHQRTAQITNENVLSALANCAIRFANSDAEARKLAGSLRTSQQFLENLDQGQFAAYVRDVTKTATAIDVIKPSFEVEGQLTREEVAQLRDKMTRDYGWETEPPERQAQAGPQRSKPKRSELPEEENPDSSTEW